MTKQQLINLLINQGVIIPSRSEMQRMTKDQLWQMTLEHAAELEALRLRLADA